MGQDEQPKHSFGALQSALIPHQGIPLEDLSEDVVQSVIYDAYKNGAVQEPIYGKFAVLAAESLARPKDDMHGAYSIGELSKEFYRRGLAEKFDVLTCSIGIKHATQLPATLNISVESALSPTFWAEIEQRVEGFEPENFIFEILEHDVDVNADIEHLKALKERGFRFALDDFTGNALDENRLAVFGDLVDYIKIDGPLVRASFDDEGEGYTATQFEKLVETLRTDHPETQLIAERVRTAEEAQTLFDMGFAGVQGRQLKPEFFPYTPEAAALASAPAACEYE